MTDAREYAIVQSALESNVWHPVRSMAYALERFWDLILAIAIQRLSRRGMQSVQTFLCFLFIELEFSLYRQTS